MSEFMCEGEYNKSTNISILRYINPLKTKDDVDKIMKAGLAYWPGDREYKSWHIADTRKLGLAPPGLVIHYNKLAKEYVKKYVEDYVVIAGTTMEKIASRLFNTFMGEKHPVVSTMEEALEIINKWQNEKGIRASKIE